MQITVVTSFVAACVTVFLLKGLHLFHLIKWQPVGFFKKWGIEGLHAFERWLILLLLLFVAALLLYMLFSLFPVRADVMSVLLGVLVAITIEWLIYRYPFEASSFKQLSVPFIVVVILIARFIIETAVFARNNLAR